jgi:hypothetical protein
MNTKSAIKDPHAIGGSVVSFFGAQAVRGGAFGFRTIQEVAGSQRQSPVAGSTVPPGHAAGMQVLLTVIVPFGHWVTQ